MFIGEVGQDSKANIVLGKALGCPRPSFSSHSVTCCIEAAPRLSGFIRDGGYVVDHSSMVYLMNADEKLDNTIPYQENDELAVTKLKSLASRAPTS